MLSVTVLLYFLASMERPSGILQAPSSTTTQCTSLFCNTTPLGFCNRISNELPVTLWIRATAGNNAVPRSYLTVHTGIGETYCFANGTTFHTVLLTPVTLIDSRKADCTGASGAAVGVFVGARVGDFVGEVVGAFVGVFVGVIVGAVVGSNVVAFVGATVGGMVGSNVVTFVGVTVGGIVGAGVVTFVGENVGNFVGVRVIGADVGFLVTAIGENMQTLVTLLHVSIVVAFPSKQSV